MKFRRFLFAFLISLAAFQFCFSQEKLKAELIDEFGKAECEDFWARFDNFFYQLQNDPSSTGYIVIYGGKNSLRANLGYEKLTDGIVRFRNLDRSRLVIIRGEERESVQIQFWKVSAGADKPIFNEGNWDLTVNQHKPFILRGYSEGDGICPTNTSVKLFADYMTANPNMRGHIILTGKATKDFADTKKDLLNQLVGEHKISSNRLRFFYVRDKTFPYKFTDAEYWLVPQKKK